MKIEEIAELWRQDKKKFIKRSSFSTYSHRIKSHVEPYFGDFSEIEESLVQKYVLEKVDEGLSRRTIRDVLMVLKMILQYGKKKGLIEFDDSSWEIKYPTVTNKKKSIKTYTSDQVKKISDYCYENGTFRNLGILITLRTGMRIGEICGLIWKNVDIERGVFVIERTINRIYDHDKGRTEIIIDSPKTVCSNREIPISPDLRVILAHIKPQMKDHYYVIAGSDHVVEPRTFRVHYNKMLKVVDIPILKFHGLRHTFATQCIAANIDVKVVSSILGHANTNITYNLYVHPDAVQQKSAIDTIFKHLQ